jgi:serine-type D-Ala-D-Ala carboxypeptidase
VTALAATVDGLLALGGPGTHPASGIAAVRTAAGTQVAAGGWARLPAAGAAGVPMSADLLLDLASVTKVAATTAAAMALTASGELDPGAPVRRYLPSFRGAGQDDITVEQLLTHTAGLRPWWPLYCEPGDRAAALERAQALPLAAPPGTAFAYSDLGLILAGHIIERVTGTGLAGAFAGLVAGPLGLTARYGPVPAGRAAASADGDAYEFAMVATGRPYPVPYTTGSFAGWRDHELRGVVNDGNAAHALDGVSGHAGLFATVADLLTLGAALRAGDLGGRAVLDRFAAPSAVAPDRALGFRRRVLALGPAGGGERLTLLSHGGFTGTFFAFALERELVIAGGAMRLYGTVGPIPGHGSVPAGGPSPAGGPGPAEAGLADSADIHDLLLDGARRVLTGQAATPANPGEER